MKHEDIDDLLSNIDGDELDEHAPQSPAKKEAPETPEEIALKAREILSRETIGDVSFLEDIDLKKSSDGDLEYKEMLGEEFSEDLQEHGAGAKAGKEEEEPQQPPQKTVEVPAKITEGIKTIEFVLKGTRTWNTREPYIAPIDTGKIRADYQDMEKTFYFIKDGANEHSAQGEMKRAMIKFISASGTNVIEEYSTYINNRLSSFVSDLGKEYNLQRDSLYLFIYHLGVLTLYRILINLFQETKSGTCYKLVTENSVAKYIPAEFVKEAVLKWHNYNIKAALPYDGIIEYNEIKRAISKKYMAECERHNARIDELMSEADKKAGGKTDRDQLFKNKWIEWFGKTNIFIYNRFLDRTVFKT